MRLFKKTIKTEDTGLRGTYEGRLYVDKTVFYTRPEVQVAIQKVRDSIVIQEQIKNSKG